MWDRVPALPFLIREANPEQKEKVPFDLIPHAASLYPAFPGPIATERLLIVHSQGKKTSQNNNHPTDALRCLHDTSVAVPFCHNLLWCNVHVCKMTD